ncbi:MAG: S46 family peptidase [Thermoflexibacter sp.]|nr:S46 family peptidase [Thermoflexibacter sp.]
MNYSKIILTAIVLSFTFTFAKADEGMWLPILLKQLNEKDMKAKGLKLSAEDIYSVNKSSLKDAIVSFGGFCTAEVVSNQGLIFTNHHCGYGAIQSHSSVNNDYLSNGFWAKSLKEELPNSSLTATFIVKIEDVTTKVLEGINIDASESERQVQINRNINKIRREAVADSHYEAVIKPFFYGNEYYLFVTETFLDVRLVGAPPSSIGKFGGDTDNWVWPRHTGDFSVFRIYAGKDNKPAAYSTENIPYKPKHFFPISLKGVKENDFSMIYGFPGRTQQYLTSEAVRYLVEKSNPTKVKMRNITLGIMDNAMKSSDQIRIQYAAKYANIANYHKKWLGEMQGLKAFKAVEKKKKLEETFVKLANSTPNNPQKYGEVLTKIIQNQQRLEKYAFARELFLETINYGSEIIDFASKVMATYDYGESLENLKSEAEEYFKNYHVPTDKAIFAETMKIYYDNVDKTLYPDIFQVVENEYNSDFKKYADFVYTTSNLVSLEKINELIKKNKSEVISILAEDPAYRLMKSLFATYSIKINTDYQAINAEIDNQMRVYVEGLRKLMPEKKYWADANNTLRLSYGNIEGSSPRDGMKYTHLTTLEGIMEKYVPERNGEFDVSPKLIELYNKKDYGQYGEGDKLVVCFTASNHTTGGNSGSPILNGNGELIGINFDRSWESTMSDVMYNPNICRNIAVDVRYVLFIIDKFAGAGYLLDEMKLIGK